MPPKRVQLNRNSLEQEGRILLAIEVIKKKEIPSIREAARRFSIPEITLCRRRLGDRNRTEIRANCHKLTENEENSLVKWVLDMDTRGVAPRLATVGEMANILLATHSDILSQIVGKNWVTNFVKRQPELTI
ncbi:hypothetical protein N7478_012164 [Penicillium angulare]|uniref:uncharacterized protein n=1 Tax=Penicillium angulare TaxID=116970 RepID=UPI002540007D|nr:uncharacterized protein N7478_012164 [Penicillium angulare]KAJ5260559.1 hypothetical protein N7478_012164 [Penicillium angulare]